MADNKPPTRKERRRAARRGQNPQRSELASIVAEAHDQTKPQTLRDLYRAEHLTEHRDQLNEEITKGSDRAVVLTLASILQRQLEKLILIRLRIYDDHPMYDDLFDRDGPLSSFFGCIMLGSALELYNDLVKSDLDTTRRIRNVFAHSPIPITLLSDPVKREVQKFHTNEYSDEEIKNTSWADLPTHKDGFFRAYISIAMELNKSLDRENKILNIEAAAASYYRRALEAHESGQPLPFPYRPA